MSEWREHCFVEHKSATPNHNGYHDREGDETPDERGHTVGIRHGLVDALKCKKSAYGDEAVGRYVGTAGACPIPALSQQLDTIQTVATTPPFTAIHKQKRPPCR